MERECGTTGRPHAEQGHSRVGRSVGRPTAEGRREGEGEHDRPDGRDRGEGEDRGGGGHHHLHQDPLLELHKAASFGGSGQQPPGAPEGGVAGGAFRPSGE